MPTPRRTSRHCSLRTMRSCPSSGKQCGASSSSHCCVNRSSRCSSCARACRPSHESTGGCHTRDSGAQMGSGHLMRCLTLAGELKSRGAEVRFVCRTLAGNLIERVELAGYRLDCLPAPAAIEGANDAVSTQHQDAAQTLAALGTDRVSWIVVDHYGLDALWQRSGR